MTPYSLPMQLGLTANPGRNNLELGLALVTRRHRYESLRSAENPSPFVIRSLFLYHLHALPAQYSLYVNSLLES